MGKKTIYVARSIRGDRKPGDLDVVKAIVAAIKAAGHQPQFDVQHTQSMSKCLNNEQYIFQRDIEWLDESHAVIAEVSSASTGVGIELAYAFYVRRIPVLCVALKDSRVSAMVLGNREWKVWEYRDDSDLAYIIQEFLAQFSQ